MNDKSPRQHLTKKSGKSLKEKRAAKRATDNTTVDPLAAVRKRKGSGS
ncbi:MAG: hypothetical protein ACSLEW_06815 [Nocardioides sp.]